MKRTSKKTKPSPMTAVPYNPAAIEKKWQRKWAVSRIYRSKESTKKKFYALDMFPYPSGQGLHVGHPKGYIATDVVSRMMRMSGHSVLHPMGFDAFGLPAENYAIKTKTNPAIAVRKNVARYKKQLEILGFDYDWSREVNTTDPDFYKWTQWTFLEMWKKGLAYESHEPVNWCPTDKTVLANEDVENGRCERCGTPVERKPMRQWVLKITEYAERLLNDLDATDSHDEPVFVDQSSDGGYRAGIPIVERDAIMAIVKHWSEDKYIGLKWKKVDWQTLITGGPEHGQTPAEGARQEIIEETGYINPRLVRHIGRVHSKFFHAPKQVNRFAHFDCYYFELENGERHQLSAAESDIHEVVWLTREEMTKFLSPEAHRHVWKCFLKNQPVAPALLDWPESIKEAQRNWIGKSQGAEIDFRLAIRDKKPRFVILHGYQGSAKTNFIPWLKRELEKRGHEVEAPELPHTNDPNEEDQVAYVLNNCRIDDRTVIIGHSLGSITALKVVMKLDRPISGLVLVAPAIDPDFKQADFRPYWKGYKWNFDYAQIQKLTGGRIAVLSDTEERLRARYLRDVLAKNLNATLTEIKATEEHFCALEEPAILKAVTPLITVFTTRPDTLYGVTYVVLAPEHPWISQCMNFIENKDEVRAYIAKTSRETEIERAAADREKTGVELKNIRLINPINGEEVPVWIADYVLPDYGTGAVMAVPAHDDRDFAFAQKFGLPIKPVIAQTFTSTHSSDAFRPAEPAQTRPTAVCIIKHPTEDRYLFVKKKGISDLGEDVIVATAGGIDAGETVPQAGQREIAEETGYSHVRFIRSLGAPVCYRYFSKNSNQNRQAILYPGYYELIDESRQDVSEHEKSLHDTIWLEQHDIQRYLDGRPFNAIFWSRLSGSSAYTGPGILVDSGNFSGQNSTDIMKEITAAAQGRWLAKYKLRDWVFSRQRYWGEPIPIIHCENCGVVPVPEKDLPVKLPKVKSYEPTGTGESPLSAIRSWVNVKCPRCRGRARRETNTMPQWAGSSWYYLRYMDPKNSKRLVDARREKYWSPVDLYVGGAEHATRHLIYARFWHKFLYDIGSVKSVEPFRKLQNVGLIMGEDGRKMSKRFGNVVNPDDIVKTYGADTLRVYEMFMGPFDQSIPWSTDSIVGCRRFIERVWKLRTKIVPGAPSDTAAKILHKTIGKVTEDIQHLHFNTAISTMMIAVNEFEKLPNVGRTIYESYLKLLAPFAPHVAEELWMSLGGKKSIHLSAWPTFDPKLAADTEVRIIVQVDGRVRGSFMAAAGGPATELERRARALPEAAKWTTGKKIAKIIVIPDRLVNIVLTGE